MALCGRMRGKRPMRALCHPPHLTIAAPRLANHPSQHNRLRRRVARHRRRAVPAAAATRSVLESHPARAAPNREPARVVSHLGEWARVKSL